MKIKSIALTTEYNGSYARCAFLTALGQVFRSLPPERYLGETRIEVADKWLELEGLLAESQFDHLPGVKEIAGGVQWWTPTSGRLIRVLDIGHEGWRVEVEFPRGGSANAANEVIAKYKAIIDDAPFCAEWAEKALEENERMKAALEVEFVVPEAEEQLAWEEHEEREAAIEAAFASPFQEGMGRR